MAQLQYLASTLATGGALVAVTYMLVRTNRRRRSVAGRTYRPSRAPAEDDGQSRLGRIARTPTTWYLGFVLATLAIVAGGIVGVATAGGSAGAVAAASLVAMVAAYMFLGTYATAKSRGRPESLAVAEGIGVIGGLVLVGMVLVLVLG